MSKVLVVDNDFATVEAIAQTVRSIRHDCSTARTAAEGILQAERSLPDLVFTMLELPDRSGLEVLSCIRVRVPGVAFVIVSAESSFREVREAMRAGACDWLTKPIDHEECLRAIRRVIPNHDSNCPPAEPHALARLAEVAVQIISVSKDVPTLHHMGRAVGHAPGCLRNWCRTANVRPRQFRDFTRALRAVWRIENQRDVDDANLLSIVDTRTLKKFRVKSGGTVRHLPTSVAEYCRAQQHIPIEQFMVEIRRALASRALRRT
jgi:CheY-like chemotaxis protein